MPKTIIIDHSKIRDANTIAQVQERAFREAGVNIHVNEVQSMDDDHKKGKRHLTVKNTKYIDLGRGRG